MAAKKGRPLRTLAYTKTFKKDYSAWPPQAAMT